MNDDLPALIARLEKEVAPLETTLRAREAEEGRRLRTEETRLVAARAKAEKAHAALKSDQAELAALERRRAELLERVKGWRGQVWSIGWGSVIVSMMALAITAFPLFKAWGLERWLNWAVLGNAVAFIVLYFLIPRKK